MFSLINKPSGTNPTSPKQNLIQQNAPKGNAELDFLFTLPLMPPVSNPDPVSIAPEDKANNFFFSVNKMPNQQSLPVKEDKKAASVFKKIVKPAKPTSLKSKSEVKEIFNRGGKMVVVATTIEPPSSDSESDYGGGLSYGSFNSGEDGRTSDAGSNYAP